MDAAVAGHDLTERHAIEHCQVPGIEPGILVPEAVAVAQSAELIGDDRVGRDSDAAARDGVFGQHANPRIHFVHRAVERLQGGGQLWIRSDLPEGAHSGQAEITADRVVAAQAVISPALDVERGQVQTAGTRRPEQEVPQRVHN